VEPGAALILVGPSRSLRRIPFLRMIEIAPGRHLLSVPPGTGFESLELALIDLLDEEHDPLERALLTKLRAQIRRGRRTEGASTAEILFIGLDGGEKRARRGRRHGPIWP